MIGSPEAKAQRWLQTSQLLVELGRDGPARALLDTVVQVVERKDMKVKRAPDSDEKVTLPKLREKLINGPGIGLASASHVFIDYRFMIKNRGFKESIEGFQFIFRRGQASDDTQMMYLTTDEKWLKDLLRNKGTSLRTNQAALKTFSDQLAFARMHKKGKVVEIAGEPVREGYEEKKKNLVDKITRLTYESM